MYYNNNNITTNYSRQSSVLVSRTPISKTSFPPLQNDWSKLFDDNGMVQVPAIRFEDDHLFQELSNKEIAFIHHYDANQDGTISFDKMMCLLRDIKKIKSKNEFSQEGSRHVRFACDPPVHL